MARYSLFVLKVPLNPKQTNKQTVLYWQTAWGADWFGEQQKKHVGRREEKHGEISCIDSTAKTQRRWAAIY